MKRLRPANQQKEAKKKNIRKKVKNEENSEQKNALDDNPELRKIEEATKNGELTEDQKKKLFDRLIEICDILLGTGYPDVYSDTKEAIIGKFIKEEDKCIRSDLDELEKDLEDLNPDHNVIEE